MTEDVSPLLSLHAITKSFPGVVALDLVDFSVLPGEVHALMGENGAGKSTLIKILSGIYTADGGSIAFQGAPVQFSSPAAAIHAGISTVHQEVNLAPNLSLAENICLGREPKGFLGIRWRGVAKRARKAVQRIGLQADLGLPARSCSIAINQMVAIARALDVEAKVLILDEPTSSLDEAEVQALFAAIRKLKDEGMGIVFITHFIEQVFAIADRITVLRNGGRVGTWGAKDLTRMRLVSYMLGRDASELERPANRSGERSAGAEPADVTKASPSPPFIRTVDLGRRRAVQGLEFSINPGDVIGLAGLLGSGRSETAHLLYGIDRPTEGGIYLEGNLIRLLNPRAATRRGFGYCGEDRKSEGIFGELSVRENMLIGLQAKRGWLRRLGSKQQAALAAGLVDRLQVHPQDAERPMRFLSGGNQQKAILARWLAASPRFLILDEPTRGIDIGAKFEIMELVEHLRREGMAFCFISSELAEVVHTCDKVVVLRDRTQVGLLHGQEISEAAIVAAIAGKEA